MRYKHASPLPFLSSIDWVRCRTFLVARTSLRGFHESVGAVPTTCTHTSTWALLCASVPLCFRNGASKSTLFSSVMVTHFSRLVLFLHACMKRGHINPNIYYSFCMKISVFSVMTLLLLIHLSTNLFLWISFYLLIHFFFLRIALSFLHSWRMPIPSLQGKLEWSSLKNKSLSFNLCVFKGNKSPGNVAHVHIF